jgi:hypothetical protein
MGRQDQPEILLWPNPGAALGLPRAVCQLFGSKFTITQGKHLVFLPYKKKRSKIGTQVRRVKPQVLLVSQVVLEAGLQDLLWLWQVPNI